MGQALVSTEVGVDVAEILEQLVPGNIKGLKPGRMRYTQLLNHEGGILDDLMVTRMGEMDGRDWLFLVVNGACKDADFAHIEKSIGAQVKLEILADRALIAFQGPKAAQCLAGLFPGCDEMAFMSLKKFDDTPYGTVWISRSGYTGEDGYELSCTASDAKALARVLVEMAEVEAIGLGARDSLRLEAGLCLYGHDIDETTSPIEANLVWSIGKRRREEGGFPGDARVLGELKDGPARRLVGIKPEGRAPAREGTKIFSADGDEIGTITSGGFGPTVGGPVAMGYVTSNHSETGTALELEVRGKRLPASVHALPFVPQNYYRKPKSST
jgi:aminomethyltransferase